jgi:hypothetical protein
MRLECLSERENRLFLNKSNPLARDIRVRERGVRIKPSKNKHNPLSKSGVRYYKNYQTSSSKTKDELFLLGLT